MIRFSFLFERTTKFVDPITRHIYDFVSEFLCLGDHTKVLQLDLDNDDSCYQLLLDPIPPNKFLLFNPTELGHITHFTTFGTSPAGMYTPKRLKKFWANLIHASVSDTVLKKLTRTILTKSKTVPSSDSGNLKRFLSLDESFSMDHLLTPSHFLDKCKERFGELGFIIQGFGNFFAWFLLWSFLLTFSLFSLEDFKFEKFLWPFLVFSEQCQVQLFVWSFSHYRLQCKTLMKTKLLVISVCRIQSVKKP